MRNVYVARSVLTSVLTILIVMTRKKKLFGARTRIVSIVSVV